jgi:UDP-hydrolysing UDP-N-acetyl-D-glucosamine 2-epimerase
MKNIGVLTGKRGGFDALLPLINALSEQDVELMVYAVDQHLLEKYGSTWYRVMNEIPQKDTVGAITVGNPQSFDSITTRCKNLGDLMEQLPIYMANSDAMILYGDRSEVLVAAQVCHLHGVPIIHFEGGEITGTTDDATRRAISQLASVHFAPTHEACERLIYQGIHNRNIYDVGDLHLNKFARADFRQLEELGISAGRDISITIYHPSTEIDPGKGMRHIGAGLWNQRDMQHVFIYPCTDPGNHAIIDLMESHRSEKDFYVYKNLDGDTFAALLKAATILIGNSSCGIKESPYVGTWALNLGDRQKGRAQDLATVNCSYEEIGNMIDRHRNESPPPSTGVYRPCDIPACVDIIMGSL